jgi:hypothetical protein
MEVLQKTKNRATVWHMYITPMCTLKEIKVNKHNIHVFCGTTYDSCYGINGWMDREILAYIHNGVLFNHKEEWNHLIFRKIDVTRDYYAKQNKPDSDI